MKPNKQFEISIQRLQNLKNQANQELSEGIRSNEAALFGELIVQQFIPHGLKSFTRKIGSVSQKTIKEKIKRKWRNIGNQCLTECESIVSQISLNTKNLTTSGNSLGLLRKFNRVRKIKNPIPFFDNLTIILQEFQNLDLIWNNDIEQELSKRKELKEIEKKEIVNLKINSNDIIGIAKNLDTFNQDFIIALLKSYPLVLNSVLGGLERLQNTTPDSYRHCITSCRASIESLCIKIGKNKDWKKSLNNIFTSDADRRQVKGVHHFLSAKGVHGGYNPTKKDAEYGFNLTVGTIHFIIHSYKIK